MTGSQNRNSDPASIGGWHLDKRVPVAIIVTILLQTMGVIWWAATTQAQTNANTIEIARINLQMQTNETRAQPLRDMVIETSTQVQNMAKTVDRQTAILDRLSSQIGQIPGVKP